MDSLLLHCSMAAAPPMDSFSSHASFLPAIPPSSSSSSSINKKKKNRKRDLRLCPNHLPSSAAPPRLRSFSLPSSSEGGRGNAPAELGPKEDPQNRRPIRTLLIDNYDSYTYNLYQLLSVINGVVPTVIKNDEISWKELHSLLYKDDLFDNIVISPGPGSATCASDIGICLQVLQECCDIPILGVCMGHQALGYANGARIVHAPEPIHGRLSEIEHTGCPLFDKIPSGPASGFKVVRYHSLILDENSIPDDLIVTAWTVPAAQMHGSQKLPMNNLSNDTKDLLMPMYSNNGKNRKPSENGKVELEKAAKVIMAVSHRFKPHYGVQFHPESIATVYGTQLLRNFHNITLNFLQSESNQALANRESFQKLVGISRFKACCQSNNWSDIRARRLYASNVITTSMSLSSNLLSKEPCAIKEHSSTDKAPVAQLGLLWERLKGIASQVGGSENIFCSLFDNHAAADTFWLDSSSFESGRARFSFMGGKGGPLWRCMSYRTNDREQQGTGVLRIENCRGGVVEMLSEDGFLKFMSKVLEGYNLSDNQTKEPLPFDFTGGCIGYLGYELKAECGLDLTSQHKSQLPDACFFFADRFVAIDHSNDDVYIVSLYEKTVASPRRNGNGVLTSPLNSNDLLFDGNVKSGNKGLGFEHESCTKSSEQVAQEWIDEMRGKLLKLSESGDNAALERKYLSRFVSSSSNVDPESKFKLQKSKEEYIRDIERCQEHIRNGESYELCLTTQLQRDIKVSDTLGLYLTLREINPAPYAALLRFGKEELTICCSSPERFLRLDQHGTLEAKPIKGTISRGSTPSEDERLRCELQNSVKDQAENLMIVDLLRNDLGRVCKPGSVHVPSLMAVESYATVHTMVSTIRGEKRDDVNALECVRAAFPGGSMTGAPKLRSIQLLESLECSPRGVYSGTIGFFSLNHSFDLNIVIRTLVVHKGTVSIGAGGAIVALSDSEDEYQEMLLKAKAPIRALSNHLASKPPQLHPLQGMNGVALPTTP